MTTHRAADAASYIDQHTLPFVGRPVGPLQRWQLAHVVRGIPLQWTAELWPLGDAARAAGCPVEPIPDPERPGLGWAIWLTDHATGAICPPLSEEQTRELGATTGRDDPPPRCCG